MSPRLDLADAVYLGSAEVDKVYLGGTLVWEPAPAGDPNLLAHYDFAGTGTTVVDLSGNGNNAVAVAGVQTGGKALIDAAGERVVLDATSAALRPTSAATICAWVNVASGGGGGQGYPIHIARAFDSTTFGLWMSRASGAVAISAVVRAGSVNILSVPTENRPAENTTFHVALVFGGSAGKIYVGGVERATAGNSGNLVYGDATYQSWQVGDHQHMPAGMTNYTVDDVRIYDRALSPAEIAALAGG